MWRAACKIILLVVFLCLTGETLVASPGIPPIGKHRQAQLNKYIAQRAKYYGISLKVVKKMIRVESRWRHNAISKKGACGLMQVRLATGREILKRKRLTKVELLDPYLKVEAGLLYLAKLRRHYDGDLRLALTAYNRGFGRVDRLLAKGEDPHNGYADKVLEA